MAASAWNVTSEFRTKLAEAGFASLAATSTFKCALFTTGSSIAGTPSTATAYSGVTDEVANGNGYATGGVAVTLNASGTVSVTLTVASGTPMAWTASGGSIAAYYAAIYQTSGDIVAWCQLDTTNGTVTVTTGNTLTISNSNPVLTIA